MTGPAAATAYGGGGTGGEPSGTVPLPVAGDTPLPAGGPLGGRGAEGAR
ncbi:hypothetical protein [Streptomyces capillispiralis]|uniref:Uncharacterized protein n=1 Tax=Streptomyces capillispiralis TaxID=68182 RepID=A0A561TB10_9ACTN|nr:hypothetical protein [Streptomyces capillispiralis]TWF84279.1 hypothetical protein FHX78_111213 [Streptomyces capillispiralis]GHH91822.1 hypothetical protein GCM10017779_22790 [Streptomyces capillispiralis]